jgi:hypothetical protein
MLKGCDFIFLLLLSFAVLNSTFRREGHHGVPSTWAKDLCPTQTAHWSTVDPHGGPCTPDEENPQKAAPLNVFRDPTSTLQSRTCPQGLSVCVNSWTWVPAQHQHTICCHQGPARAERCGRPECRRQCLGTCRDGEALLYRLERKRARESGLQICAPENCSPPFIVRLCILGRQTVVRPDYNPVPCLLFRSHPRDVFLVCVLSNIELRMTLMCKSKKLFFTPKIISYTEIQHIQNVLALTVHLRQILLFFCSKNQIETPPVKMRKCSYVLILTSTDRLSPLSHILTHHTRKLLDC